MLVLETCRLPHRIRQFYQLSPIQQKTLLDIVEEMLVMNAEVTPPPVLPVPHLHAVK
jgi:hypothetical protein